MSTELPHCPHCARLRALRATVPAACRFGCPTPPERLTRVHYPEGCWCFPDEPDQWLCPQHTIKGLQNNAGATVQGYLHDHPEALA